MVDILCGFGGGQFVLDSNFLEGLRFEFGTCGAVAGGTEAEVRADDFLFSVGQRVGDGEDFHIFFSL